MNKPTNVYQLKNYLRVGCQVHRTYLNPELRNKGISGTHIATVCEVRHDGVVFKCNSIPKLSTLEISFYNDILFDDCGFRIVDHQTGMSIVRYDYVN